MSGRVSELFPIVSTVDVERSLGFYRDLLGGTVTFSYPSPDGTIVYVGVDIGSSQLGIGLSSDRDAPPSSGTISLWVYTDGCDAVVERVRAAGWRITEEPTDQPWGERVARVQDPDGNEVIVGQRLKPEVGLDALG